MIFTQGDELDDPAHGTEKSSPVHSASGAASFEQAERQVIINALRAASGKVAGQGGAAERPRAEKNDTSKQDAQVEHHSCRLRRLNGRCQCSLSRRNLHLVQLSESTAWPIETGLPASRQCPLAGRSRSQKPFDTRFLFQQLTQISPWHNTCNRLRRKLPSRCFRLFKYTMEVRCYASIYANPRTL